MNSQINNHPAPKDAFWNKPASQLFEDLASSAAGLSASAASERLDKFGPNALSAGSHLSGLAILANQFKSPIILILIFATLISAIVKDWIDAAIILAIVGASSLLSFFQEYNAHNAAEKLKNQIALKASVLRDGKVTQVLSREVVPGDVVFLSAGSMVPADGLILEAKDLFINQSVLTGETFPVEKAPGVLPSSASLAEQTNCVFMGTNVRSGSAKILVVHTGKNTSFGAIAKTLTLRAPETEFERGVRRFGSMLSEIMLIMVLLVLVFNVLLNKPFMDSLLFSIALAVGLTPQLLPAIISINLSKGAQIMARSGVIVRRLNAIENFGSMDVLCTDKTGTLTQGVVKLDGALDLQGSPSDEVFRLAYLNASLQSGLENSLDEAIKAAKNKQMDSPLKLDEIPYDFMRKRLSIVVAEPEGSLMITKGALDHILEICTSYDAGGKVTSFAGHALEDIEKKALAWEEQGFRVLGIATKTAGAQKQFSRLDETEMTFRGFLLFYDPPKLDAADTINDLKSLGVSLKIITGDSRNVTLHIAEKIGLAVSGVLTGRELNDINDEALWHVVESTNLFVEVDPNQKERIINSLQKRNHVVGYMGDGINDAPSLHNADVGISVDSAVDVAKEAADFVLLRHDLDVLKRGILLGRTTFANTLKYINVTTSANFGNMVSMAGVSLLLPFLPLLPFQVLLTNFLTDFPAMMIAGDSVDDVMVQCPHRWNIRSLRRFMVVFGVISSVFDYITFFYLLKILKSSQDVFRTGWFIQSVLTELLALLILRSRQSVLKSRIGKGLWITSLLIAILTISLPYIPGIGSLLSITPLPLPLMVSLIGITLLYSLANEIGKRYFYRKQND
jgi:Mg2+-importing ATPase